jgi:hypothetical protein
MYAVSADAFANSDAERRIQGVLKSTTNGDIWSRVGANQALIDKAGFQGEYNNCIAVAPTDPTRVLVGWQAGTFHLTGSGDAFTLFDGSFDANMHSDVHGVYFDPADPANDTFYICSDGGVAKTKNGSKPFDARFNSYLANLECYGISVRGDLLSCAVQDNGTIYCGFRLGNNPNVSPWVRVQPDDGTYVCLIASGQLIASTNGGGGTGPAWLFQTQPDNPLRFIVRNDAKPIPVLDQNGDDEAGLQIPSQQMIEPVNTPTYACAGQKMYAVAGGPKMSERSAGTGLQTVHGLFANDNWSKFGWVNIGSVTSDVAGDPITAVAALDDGTSVLVGTLAGRFFLLKPSCAGPVTGQRLVVSSPQGQVGQVSRIVFVSPTSAIAVSGNSIVRYDGSTWSVVGAGLPAGPYNALARDGYKRTWTCTGDKVFVSRDDGLTWKDASVGLPVNVRCNDLRYNFAQQNPPLLYLATWGHSVWVTDVLG